MFTNRQLYKMIVPLFIEQFLLFEIGQKSEEDCCETALTSKIYWTIQIQLWRLSKILKKS